MDILVGSCMLIKVQVFCHLGLCLFLDLREL